MRGMTVLLALGVLASCEASPTAPENGTAETMGPALDGSSGCYSVRFESEAEGLFPFFAGTISGDLSGTTLVEFDPSAVVLNGVRQIVAGTTTWDITGGVVSELVGQSFVTSTVANTLFLSDNDPAILEITGRDRAESGVDKANFTFAGEFDARDGAPPFEVVLQYNGVICP